MGRSLLKELETFHKQDWADVVNLQRAWIGEVNGTVFDWIIDGAVPGLLLPIWTDKPEHMYKVGFIAVKQGTMLDIMQVMVY